ncbi:MAG: hypothetical protein M9894_38890 [Planctomycetes bacterium]|nr:hypothetical protein [Planctomycetota bacterium]
MSVLDSKPVPGGQVRLVQADRTRVRVERVKDGQVVWSRALEVVPPGGDPEHIVGPSRLLHVPQGPGVVVVQTTTEHARGGEVVDERTHRVDVETGV